MRYTDEKLSAIYDRTSGYCHICHKKLSFQNYGKHGKKGAWQVEHSRARAKDGSDRTGNLYPACIDCNLEKSTATTRTARAWHGTSRAPLSRQRRRDAKRSGAVVGGIVGGLLGALAGPWGAAAGVAIGAKLGHDADPDDR
jgi:hypothetical protein